MRVAFAIIAIFAVAFGASAQFGPVAADPVPAAVAVPAAASSIEVTVGAPEAALPFAAAAPTAAGRAPALPGGSKGLGRAPADAHQLAAGLVEIDRVLAKYGGTRVAFSVSDILALRSPVLPHLNERLERMDGEAVKNSDMAVRVAERMLDMICLELGLQRQRVGNLWVVTRRPTVVFNNQQVPVVGAVVVPQAGPSQVGGSMNAALQALRGFGGLYPGMQYAFPGTSPFPAELERIPNLSNPINLEAKNQPMVDFMAEVAKQSGQAIEVHPGVRREITVTASIAGLSAREVVTAVAAQAGLMVQVQRRPTKEALDLLAKQGPTTSTVITEEQMEIVVHIVPPSAIRVNVPGGFVPGNVVVTPQPR